VTIVALRVTAFATKRLMKAYEDRLSEAHGILAAEQARRSA